MKTSVPPLLAGLLLGACTLRAAPLSITVSPTQVTNNYVGTIQLAISNLSSPGVTVRVERFLNNTSNGIIEVYDWAGQSFSVTDGQEPIIGGIRNSNVPGDDDGVVNGAILTHVPYPGVDLTLNHVSGQYIYRVTDLGNASTATAIMGIAQQVLPQGVQGQVFAGNGQPLSNAPVVVSQETGNNGFGTVSDGNGNYSIYAPPGEYEIVTVYNGQIANLAAGITINSNLFTTNNVTNITSDGTTISGKVSDLSTGAGLPGVAISANTSLGLFAFIATDVNGNYILFVNSNKWTVGLNGDDGAILGYCVEPVHKISVNASSNSVPNVDFQMPRGNALVYGRVVTSLSNAVSNVIMEASDTNYSLFEGEGVTDSNGNYAVAVVAGGDTVEPDSSSLAGFVSPPTAFFTVNTNQAVQENFVLQAITATLSGVVEDNFGNPLGNTQLYADPASDQTGSLSEYFDSAPNGSFSVGVGPGTWNLALECVSGASSNLISETLTVDVTNGVNVSNLVLVAQHATATIYGKVTDSSGQPLAGVNMFANASVGPTNYLSGCVNTDSNGDYSIPVFPAEWSVGGNYPGMTNEDATITGSASVMLNFVISPQSGPPTLGAPSVSGGQVRFQVMGNNGQEYRIDAATNLLPNDWAPVYTNYGSFPFSAPLSTNRAQFYRAVAVP